MGSKVLIMITKNAGSFAPCCKVVTVLINGISFVKFAESNQSYFLIYRTVNSHYALCFH